MPGLEFQPQNAKSIQSVDNLPNGGDYLIEPKFDGWRMLAHTWHECGVSGVTFFTRTGESHSGSKFPKIEKELCEAFPQDSWIDGELVSLTAIGSGRQDEWARVQNFAGAKNRIDDKGVLSYAVFDVLMIGSHDARSLPFGKRRELLEKALAAHKHGNIFAPAQFAATQEIHEVLVARGWEGSIVKDRRARYASGKRGYGWFKLKATWSTEGIIMSFQDGKAGWAGMVGAIIFGQYDNRCTAKNCNGRGEWYDGYRTFECQACHGTWSPAVVRRGKCSGFDLKLRKAMTADPEDYIGKIVEVQHNGEMVSGGLRHPQFLRIRTDKRNTDVVWGDK